MVYIYIYIYIHTHITYIYTYIYIEREREVDRPETCGVETQGSTVPRHTLKRIPGFRASRPIQALCL